MCAKAVERSTHVVERSHIADGAEETEHDLVFSRQRERRHVRFVDLAARQLGAGDPNEVGIDVQSVDVEAVCFDEESRVLGRSTRDVQDRARRRMLGANERRKRRGFGGIILELRVDEIVQLGGFGIHALESTPDGSPVNRSIGIGAERGTGDDDGRHGSLGRITTERAMVLVRDVHRNRRAQ